MTHIMVTPRMIVIADTVIVTPMTVSEFEAAACIKSTKKIFLTLVISLLAVIGIHLEYFLYKEACMLVLLRNILGIIKLWITPYRLRRKIIIIRM